MTKLVKEHIAEEIKKGFAEERKALENSKSEVEQECRAKLEIILETAREQIGMLTEQYPTLFEYPIMSGNGKARWKPHDLICHNFYRMGDSEFNSQRKKAIAELNTKVENTTKNVILEMELGGKKSLEALAETIATAIAKAKQA